MNFSRPRPRRPAEPALPMINVVFLLLIFFLMSAQIAPPPPFDVTPPAADGPEGAEAQHILYVSAEGELAFNDARGEAVWPAFAALDDPKAATALIRADAALDAATLARIMARLSAMGLGEIRLVTAPR